ncbi:MAG: flavodoxin family protein [Desulfobacterales bacterium]|nr:flavodoxin family protein [Desulfobacterales bacterium]
MRVTGIVSSPRRTGNSDILVKEALKGATAAGAEVQIIRLYDFRIEYCRGCEKCVVQEDPECPIKDDVRFIYQQIKQSDCLIVGSPIYIHSIPGILKTLIDRMRPYVVKGEPWKHKLTSFVFTHTFASQFEHIYALPPLLFFSFYLNFRVSGILSVSAGSPGECLLERQNIRRAHELGEKLGRDFERPAERVATFPHGQAGIICPACNNLTFNLGPEKITCPVCKEEGVIAGDSIDWRNKSEFRSLKEIMDERFRLIKESHLLFRENFRAIIEAKDEFRDNRIGIPVVGKVRSE